MAKLTKKQKTAIGVGVTAAAAAAVGAYFLTGKRGKKNRKKIKNKYDQVKKDVEKHVSKLKDVNKETYLAVVEEIAKAYKNVSEVDTKELKEMVDELKGHWDEISSKMDGKKKKTKSKKGKKKK